MSDTSKKTSWLFWLFVAIWNLVAWILKLTGRLAVTILGLAFMVAGAIIAS